MSDETDKVGGEDVERPASMPDIKVYKVLEPLEYNGAQYPEGARIQLTEEDAAEVDGSLELVEDGMDAPEPTAEAPTVIEDSETLADNMSDEDGDGENAGDSDAEQTEENAEASTSDDNAPTSQE